jgi:hypothetical protein
MSHNEENETRKEEGNSYKEDYHGLHREKISVKIAEKKLDLCTTSIISQTFLYLFPAELELLAVLPAVCILVLHFYLIVLHMSHRHTELIAFR